MSSDDYRDGCSKRWTPTWLLVLAVYAAAWLSGLGRKGGDR